HPGSRVVRDMRLDVHGKFDPRVLNGDGRCVDELASGEKIVERVARALDTGPVDAVGDAVDAESELPLVDDGGDAGVNREAVAVRRIVAIDGDRESFRGVDE